MGSDRVGPTTRREYLARMRERYAGADRASKQRLLDEVCAMTGYHRKAVIRALRRPPRQARRRVGRPRQYGPAVIGALRGIWEAAGYPWSARLRAVVPLWLPWARTHLRIAGAVETKLRAMSARQMDRALQPYKRQRRPRPYGRTKPGTLLKHQIPVQTGRWAVHEPGFTEIDLVAHSGDRADGPFIYSLNVTDIHTTWVETRAVMGKHQVDVQTTLEALRHALPFRLRGIDSDNGGEFINAHLQRYCRHHGVHFTRGRPYKKDDNAHIEQKNWTHVRKLLGYDRYDSQAALTAINVLYADLRVLQNLFLPSVKLLEKRRVGARVRRRYDAPHTPLDRLRACPTVDPATVAQLEQRRAATDPFALARHIEAQLTRIHQLANHRVSPAASTRRVDADGGVDAKNAPTTALETRTARGFPQPPHASSSARSVTHNVAR
jgi:hypothetical protein